MDGASCCMGGYQWKATSSWIGVQHRHKQKFIICQETWYSIIFRHGCHRWNGDPLWTYNPLVKIMSGLSRPTAVTQPASSISLGGVKVSIRQEQAGDESPTHVFYQRYWRLRMSITFLKASLAHIRSPSPASLAGVAPSCTMHVSVLEVTNT